MSLANDIINDHSRVGLTISKGVLIVPVQVELYDDVLYGLKNDALKMIQQRELHGLLLDLSELNVMDHEMARQLAQLIKMALLLGARGMVTGLQPGVAAAMADWDDLWDGVDTAISMDAGLEVLNAA